MDKVKISVMVEVSSDPIYCEQCEWMEYCPPGCRLFKTPLDLCLAKAPMRCAACLAMDGATIGYDLIAHLHRQRAFSLNTFGPGERFDGVMDHIKKECKELRQAPKDLEEWIDLVLLAFDGAWRAGFTPEQIAAGLFAKQGKNEARKWPDWKTAPAGKAIEHIRESKEDSL